MNERQRGIIIGCLIILIGVLILLGNLNILNFSTDISIGGIFLLVGITFLSFYFNEPQRVHLLFWGEILCIIGLTIVISALDMIPYYFRDGLIGISFLWGAAAIFFTIYIIRRAQIWSVIFSGILFTLGWIVLLDEFTRIGSGNLGAIFLAGTALSFALFYGISPYHDQAKWAKVMAIIFGGLAILIFYIHNHHDLITRIIVPTIIILIGVYYVYVGIKSTKNEEISVYGDSKDSES